MTYVVTERDLGCSNVQDLFGKVLFITEMQTVNNQKLMR